MKAHVLIGSKSEIAQTLAQFDGDIREAIVFVEEPSDRATAASEEDIFAEMEQFTARAGDADYSRQALYSRMVGE
jgi:hypothetical protein